jgi:amidohydrolase
MDLRQQITQRAKELYPEIRDIRRHLHRYPELSFHEFATSEYIRSLLDSWNISYRFPFVETGILATIRGAKESDRVVALRCDMDALPVSEKTGLEYASVNEGIMHACGHDIHMACVLGAAKILSSMQPHFGGTVQLIFQPGEEKIPGGAKLMMEEGIFSEAEPDVIIGQHVLPEMEQGKVGFKPGMYMASSDEIYITVNGKGGHGAQPENINDPVLMTSHILISLQQEINRKSPKDIPTVLSFGKVVADGAVNVIPDSVRVEGTFRTMNESWRATAHNLITRVADGIAQSMGGSADVEIRKGYPVLINDPEKTSEARDLACELLGSERVEALGFRMTAEDFAWFSQRFPSVFYRLGVKNPALEDAHRLHTSTFAPDESAIQTGMTMLSWLAMRFLEKG